MGKRASIDFFIRQFGLCVVLAGLTLLWWTTAQAVTINGGAALVNTPSVQLTLALPANCYQVQFQNEGGTAVTFTSPAATMPWTLSSGDGSKTVKVTYSYWQTYTYECNYYMCVNYCVRKNFFSGYCYEWHTEYCHSDCQMQQSNSSSESAYVTLDRTLPVLTLSTLADGSYTNNPTLNVNGIARDLNGIHDLTVAGSPVSVGIWDMYAITVSLQPGPNVITAVAHDNAGNTSTVSRTITFDTQNPALSVTDPVKDGVTDQPFITV
ncbi:MAG: hypothetical protein V1791_01915, partial [Pseudomonadota bacterium]